jgi:hypothetical protein
MLDLDLTAPAAVIVAWRTGRNAHGRAVKAGGPATESLRGYAATTLDLIAADQRRTYDPDDEQERECPYLTADRDELLDTALLGKIEEGSSLPLATDNELHKRTLALYALLVGNDPNTVAAFVRRGNPVKVAKRGFYALLDQTLTKVENPLLSFDNRFDVVISPGDVHILDQKNFEALFKESEAVLAKTAEWADELNNSVPLSDDSRGWLAKRLRSNSVMRRRVRSILKSDSCTN